MTTTTHVALGDSRGTTYTIQTISVTTGTCCAEHGACGKPGVIAVRNTITQQQPDESSTMRVTMCAQHRDGAERMHNVWVASAREMQDPAKNAAFLAQAGVTN